MIWLKILSKIVKILKSNDTPRQIASAVAFGVILGFMPIFKLQWIMLLFLVLIINVNLASFFLFAAISKILAICFSPLSHFIGLLFLTRLTFLKPFWMMLDNLPIFGFTKFNNTVVNGGFFISLILAVFFYHIFFKVIVLYRSGLLEKLEKYKIIKVIKIFQASKLYKFYKKLML